MIDTAIEKTKKPVVMKNGLVHFISEDVGDRLNQQLISQTAHSFIFIQELGININTAEISGVYTMVEYDELTKVKQGMWKCTQGIWHGRRDKCECLLERRRKLYERKKELEWEKEYGKRTPEEVKQITETIEKIRIEMERVSKSLQIK